MISMVSIETGGYMAEDNKETKMKVSEGSQKARDFLKGLIDPLADLADAGDGAVQDLLIDFGSIGKQLLSTATLKPGDPCPDCGVVHGADDEVAPESSERIIN